jgi:putative transposase
MIPSSSLIGIILPVPFAVLVRPTSESKEMSQDLLKVMVAATLQQRPEPEMDEALAAEKGERTSNGLGYRSGYCGRALITRIGKIGLRVPQDRQGRFRTEVFERYRSEKTLVMAMMEMYLRGVSTRKVKAVAEKLCGHEFSSATISRIVSSPDEELGKFARRRLEEN